MGDADNGAVAGGANEVDTGGPPAGLVFCFETWASDNGLTKKTVATLKQEDLTTEAVLRLLEDEDVALVTTTVGQRKMLQAAVKDFRVTSEQCP